ncbi:MAG TPA: hypothetical protein VGP46_05010, partial [Acidimicrobiales bacterium]|nr:hypothetical protein [Acidimicrobiales bacterium]
AVEITVTGCQGLLGGSGSNAAGYACRGSYSLDGRHVDEPLPGSTLYSPGSLISGVAVPGDPSLVVPDRILVTEHASDEAFILPLGLSAGSLLFAGIAIRRRRRGRSGLANRPERAGSRAYRLRGVAGGV